MTITINYRPWGPLRWLLDHSPALKFGLLGAINTEDRCLSTWFDLRHTSHLDRSRFVCIRNPESRFKSDADLKLKQQRDYYISHGGTEAEVLSHDLLEPYGSIIEFAKEGAHENTVLDISSMPKRFFFPILRYLVRSIDVQNLIVTYSMPKNYTDQKLSYNCDDWAHLPTFSGEESHGEVSNLVIGVGFEPMGLPQEISEEDAKRIKLLFPFPAPPKSVHRAWRFVETLQKGRDPSHFDIFHTDPRNVSDSYDRLKSISRNGQERAILAPFGPKPVSVAMCLFAIQTGDQVFYTQPSVYHHEYSTEILKKDNVPVIYAYWIKINGRNLYTT